MARFLTARLALACAGLSLAAPPAQAGLISYTESATASPATVFADHTTASGVRLVTDPGTLQLAGSTSLVPLGLKTFSAAPAGHPARFTDRPFRFTLLIKDKASGVQGTTTFTGVFDGTLSAVSADLRVRFTSPTTRVLHLGHDLYGISVGEVTLGAPGGPGGIGVQIQTHHNPEPSTLLLPALALARRRRRAAAG